MSNFAVRFVGSCGILKRDSKKSENIDSWVSQEYMNNIMNIILNMFVFQRYANGDTLNVAELAQKRQLPPRPKPLSEPKRNLLRNDSGANWSEASDFQFHPSPEATISATVHNSSQQFFNHDYEDGGSVPRTHPLDPAKKSPAHPLDPPNSGKIEMSKSVSFEEKPKQDQGRMFKFVVKGPVEHAKFTVPFVESRPKV